jgi:SAM-dependent methyltransferase
MGEELSQVERHYGRGGLLQGILQALAEAGCDIEHLSIEELAPIDELHSRRRAATRELASLLAPRRGAHVLDVGSGIGGPARYLAAVHGCRLTGIDLTQEFVTTAIELTRRTGLEGRVEFRQASALALPFPDSCFDHVWSQNVAMNIADRSRYYAEMHRVLKPAGRLALQDVTQGSAGVAHYPVVWADTPAQSFLKTAAETRSLLEAAGFRVLVFEDKTAVAVAEAQAERARLAADPDARSALGINLIIGPSFKEKMRNSRRNLEERRTGLINALLARR